MLITAGLFGICPFMPSTLTMGMCSILLHQITPEARHGEALGLRLMAINASNVVMPVLFGFTGALVGVAAVFWATGAVVGPGSRAAWLLRANPGRLPLAPTRQA